MTSLPPISPGQTVYQLAEAFGIHRITVGIILGRRGVPTRRTIPEADWPMLVRLRDEGCAQASMARCWGVSVGTVYKTLVKCRAASTTPSPAVESAG